MSDQDVFKETPTDPNGETPVAPSSEVDPIATKLASIVREDGTPKYDNIEKALDALAESQSFISKITQENSSLRTQQEELAKKAEKADTLEEVINRLKNSPEPKESTPPVGKEITEATVSEIDKAVDARIKAREEQEKLVSNFNNVNQQLLAKFGERANEIVRSKAKELDLTLEEFKTLAAKSPKLVLGHFEIKSNEPAPSTSSVNTVGFRPKEDELKRPEQSLLSGPGANTKNITDFMSKIRAESFKKYGITE